MLIVFHCNKQITLIFIFSLFVCFEEMFYLKEYKVVNKDYDFLDSISKLCLIIIYFIQKRNSKNINRNSIRMSINFFKSKLSILLFFSVLYHLIFLFCKSQIKEDIQMKEYYIILMILFLINMLRNKNQIYLHHKLSLIIIIICFIIIRILVLKVFNITLGITFMYEIIKAFCFSFYITLIKYINETYFTNIYLLGVLNGFCEIIYYIIQFNNNNNSINFFNAIIILILDFILNFLFFNILYKLSTIHTILGKIIGFVFVQIIWYFNGHLNLFFTFSFESIIILSVFFCLVFLEILELRFCGLNHNLNITISERAKIDALYSINLTQSSCSIEL